MSERIAGTVRWFNSSRGYGFISRDGGKDVFVHYSPIQTQGLRTLEEGRMVKFAIEDSPKGPQAIDVLPVL